MMYDIIHKYMHAHMQKKQINICIYIYIFAYAYVSFKRLQRSHGLRALLRLGGSFALI